VKSCQERRDSNNNTFDLSVVKERGERTSSLSIVFLRLLSLIEKHRLAEDSGSIKTKTSSQQAFNRMHSK
jgi:hypothetical protein